MNYELRLILLIAGIIVLMILYFRGSAAERTARRRHTVRDEPDGSGIPAQRSDAPARHADYELPDFSDLESLYADSRDSLPAMNPDPGVVSGSAPGEPAAGLPSRSAGIVALHIISNGDPFRGAAILGAARSADLIFGVMNIFHCYAEGPERNRERIFSVSDIYEPGSFELEHMAKFSTMGLSLFMCLPSPIGNLPGFERMYQAARIFSGQLGGIVCGEDRQPLQAEQLAALRRSLVA